MPREGMLRNWSLALEAAPGWSYLYAANQPITVALEAMSKREFWMGRTGVHLELFDASLRRQPG